MATPLTRIAELEIDPAQLEAYRRLLAAEIEASLRHEPGVLAIEAVALAEAPAQIRIFEVYADQAAYQAHLRSPHFLAYKAGTAAMVKGLRLVQVDPVRVRARALDF